ncbi:hypothetical protein OHV05_35735 (plasmid) [Kitasatospora sp. NBC_00070]|uniref:DedA family protein n=1 Tax=Kitasatospora sp. NBC_00070 TaxID=2975962 RepID=UPI00324E57AC
MGPVWICALALLAVLGDAFLPFIPSGTLVILAVLNTSEMEGALLLAAGVAVASFLGDLVLLNLVRRGSPSVQRRLDHRPELAASVARLQQYLTSQTGWAAALLVIVARFVPAGRTILDLAVGNSTDSSRRFLRLSALAALVWASYIVSLGWLNSRWFNTDWLSLVVSCFAATAISTTVVRLVRRRRRELALAGR